MKKSIAIILILFYCLNPTYPQIVEIEIKTFLEGPYFNGQMTPLLNVLGYLPLSQPYNDNPWNYFGNEQVTTIPSNDIIDWILVDILRLNNDSIPPYYEIINRKAGFILNNGFIVNLDGISNLYFFKSELDQIYIRLNHRNHLPIISSNPLSFSNGFSSVDFTVYPENVLGGERSLISLSLDCWGMICADGNSDGRIDNRDKNESWFIQKNQLGYYNGDFNLDTQVDIDDKIVHWDYNVGRSSISIRDTNLFNISYSYCNDSIIDYRDGKVYKTTQIGTQCWMTENLNFGIMIIGDLNQTNNAIFEKYCFNNSVDSCDIYGGLYQWDEVMQYQTAQGVQGICTDGWHVPTDEDWYILENYLDPTINDPTIFGWRGINAGTKLKFGGSSGFNALLEGRREYNSGVFTFFGTSHFWSSTDIPIGAIYRRLELNNNGISRTHCYHSYGFPVRCIKDIQSNNPPLPINPMPEDGSINISTDTTLYWSCDSSFIEPLFFNVYFGITPDPPLVQSFIQDTSYCPGILALNSNYYWKVVVYNLLGDSTVGNIWNFQTISISNCGAPFLDTRDGQVYSTIQIGTQCWIAENLNFGTMINGNLNQTNNGIFEKYCFNNSLDSCDNYGGLYQWDEMMQYQTVQGVQGICPDGWHIPTDYEWYVLEKFLDPTINDPTIFGWRGIDAGTKLKFGGSSGFNALLEGRREYNSGVFNFYGTSHFWSSTDIPIGAIYRRLELNNSGISRTHCYHSYGFPVRCIND